MDATIIEPAHLAAIISGLTLLLAVIVVAPFILCCYNRDRNSDEESQQLMDNSEDEAQRRKSQTFHPSATKRQSYGGTPSASTLPPYVKYTRRSCDLPSKSTLTTVPEISIETSNPQKSVAQSKGGLGQRMDGNKHALDERKRVLSTAVEKTSGLESEAGGFALLTEQLLDKHKKKKGTKKAPTRVDELKPKMKHKIKLKWGKK